MTDPYSKYFDFDQTGLKDTDLLRRAHEDFATTPDVDNESVVIHVRAAQMLQFRTKKPNDDLIAMTLVVPLEISDFDIKRIHHEYSEKAGDLVQELSEVNQAPEQKVEQASDDLKRYYLAMQIAAMSLIWEAGADHDIMVSFNDQLTQIYVWTADLDEPDLQDEAVNLISRLQDHLGVEPQAIYDIKGNTAKTVQKNTPKKKGNGAPKR